MTIFGNDDDLRSENDDHDFRKENEDNFRQR
jgi:hypothetical protein